MAEIADDEFAGLPEFALLRENAQQAGVTGPLPGVERVRVQGDQPRALVGLLREVLSR